MQLVPGVRRVGNDIVALHLIETPAGITMIDAGLPGHWPDLLAELAAMGRGIDDIRGVVLTHGDSDHIGIAERLRRDHGVPVYVHTADAARARGETTSHASGGSMRFGAVLGFAAYALRKGGVRARHLTEVVEVHDGETLPLPGAPQIIGLPGHSPGSVAVFVPSVDTVFVGDALTTRNVLTGAVGPQPAPFTDDPVEALRSLEALSALEAHHVVPGHGPPWSGSMADVIRQARA
ncbi:MBL fold metallo-hydrolase [Microterricola viridarii]|uniref:Glyoxylase, beta-lactamase superfamily II n=1 Tax=Microterricola viridarii TaxID=412690 RepID=A0A1H1WK94_9MICO|nr:MBL fold metallo-hydrolase [Microterricola viridarii]SDS97573.1 Glyoxylase, beta-lactamase superfamily II [Microterricola viridarii]